MSSPHNFTVTDWLLGFMIFSTHASRISLLLERLMCRQYCKLTNEHPYNIYAIDPFHVRENVSKLEDKTKEI